MKIEMHEMTVRDISNGYKDNGVDGVTGYDGKLDIRPAYQREFIYGDKERKAVMDTINKGFPLNVMYWAKNEDGTFELLDGQQRTISFCQYVNKDFSVDERTYDNLTQPEKEKILNYKLEIYICDGDEKEKLDWFEIINIAGKPLTKQEMRNAIYSGPWVSAAKLHFSKPNCGAYLLGKNYISGALNRQDFLQTALDWISGGKIEEYMSRHQHDENDNELWLYFQNVISWVKAVFTTYRPAMKGVDWGTLYNKYKTLVVNTAVFESRTAELMMDDEVDNKKGIYAYLLSGEEKTLSLRTFSESQKAAAYERQQGFCPMCEAAGKVIHYALEDMEADHIVPWSRGGKTTPENCQMLCKFHNKSIGAK